MKINPLNLDSVDRQQFHAMAQYLQGMADALTNENLATAASMLKDAAEHICAQGYYGCRGGKQCTSDHK